MENIFEGNYETMLQFFMELFASYFILFFLCTRVQAICFFIFLEFFYMIPKKVFFTKGVGVHKDQLASFELALRQG